MIKQFPVYLIVLISFLIGQEIKWEHYPEKTALKIATDTPGIPIYVDGLQVGVAPLTQLVEVFPGWHRVSYFPDTDNPYKSIFPKDRRINDIIRMGTVNILVEKGQILDVVLNYQSIEEEVRTYQRSVNSGRWIGFTMVMAVLVVLTWIT